MDIKNSGSDATGAYKLIDYFMRWADEANAKADVIVLANHFGVEISPGIIAWTRDRVLPNVKAWRPSQDVGGVHTYQTGWFAIVSMVQQVSVLLNASALAFALNRNGPPYIVKNNIGAIITDIAVAPIFCGSHYPIGGYT